MKKMFALPPLNLHKLNLSNCSVHSLMCSTVETSILMS